MFSNVEPLAHGMMDTLACKVASKDLAKCVLSSKKSVVNEIEKKVQAQWKKNYYPSHENLLRSLNVYYAQDVMGKAKYRATRKANQSDSVPNFVPYSSLSKYIRELDIGELYDVQDKYGEGVVNEDLADGVCRSLSKYAIRLAQFYICVNRNRVDKLLTFKSFPKKNPNSTLFVIGLGGDGAPGVGTAILISFLNVANRIASSSENFLLFGANVGETASVVKRYIQELIADVRYLESQTFEVVFDDISFPVEFKLGELPNDMKMLCFLAGELSNAALYFSTFANVSSKTSRDPTKSISDSVGDWNPFAYEKRLENAEKVSKKKSRIIKDKYQEGNSAK